MTRKTRAVLMNAFLLPGLGQLYVGRKLHGVFIILFVNILMLVALFVLLKAASPLIAAKMTAGGVNPDDLHAAIQGVAGVGKGVIAAFIAAWGYALFDLVKYGKED